MTNPLDDSPIITLRVKTSSRIRSASVILRRGICGSLIITGVMFLLVQTAVANPNQEQATSSLTNPTVVDDNEYPTIAELYDSANGTWTKAGHMSTGRANHTATLLPSGLVLVAGGFDGSGIITSAELYDPSNRSWSLTGSLNNARNGHTATLLPNGQVLVVGGTASSPQDMRRSAELYDPLSGTWTLTGNLAA
jgi:hypothetical protein